MPGGLARHADHVHVVLDGVAGGLGRRLEQRADVDVEAEVGEGGGDHLGAAVVAVLAHLHHEHAGPAALGVGEGLDVGLDGREALVALVGRAVHARDATDLGPVAAEHVLHGVGDLADGGPGPGRLDGQGQQVAVAAGALGERGQRRLCRPRRRGWPAPRSSLAIWSSRTLVLSMSSTSTSSAFSATYLLTPTTTSSPRSTRGLAAGRRLLDAQLGHARLDGLGHAAELLDLLDERPGLGRPGRR